MLDWIALALLGLFVAIGAWRGTLVTGLSLVTLGAGYAAAWAAATHLGARTGERLELPPLLGPPVAGALAFVAVFGGLTLVSRALAHWERGRRGDAPRHPLDRLGGGVLGSVRGALVVLLIGWLGLWLDAARSLRQAEVEPKAKPPLAEGTALGGVAQKVVQAGVEAALTDAGAGGRLAARVLARPRETLAGMQMLVEHEHIVGLASDEVFWTYVEHGAVDPALNRASFYRILHDPELRRELAAVGLIDEAAAAEPALFRHEARQVLLDLAPRLRSVRQDPALQELAEDPTVAAALHQRNVMALLRHPGFRQLVARALSGPSEPG